MTKFRITTVALAAWLSLGVASSAMAEVVKGGVKTVAGPAQSIALNVKDKGVMVFKFNANTKFIHADSYKDIISDEVLIIDFDQVGVENLAKTITKEVVEVPAGVKSLKTADVEALINNCDDSYVLIDSRPSSRYDQGHLPGSISIPLPVLEKEGAKVLPADKNITLVFYCGGLSCHLSPASAAIAVKLGYTDVRMYAEGEPKWVKMDNATEPSLNMVKTGNIVLVDLRAPEKAVAGYIPRAVNIPAAKLAAAETQFPEFKGAPVVFYSDQQEDMISALSLAREWGYKNATVLLGGVTAWQKAGNELVKGPPGTKISYVRKLTPGEISINDFNIAAATGTHVIIDARTAKEFAAGHFLGAVNIPAEEMAGRFKEIPVGKKPMIHCATGSRAEMAYDVLKTKGVEAQYLRSNIDFGGTTAVMTE